MIKMIIFTMRRSFLLQSAVTTHLPRRWGSKLSLSIWINSMMKFFLVSLCLIMQTATTKQVNSLNSLSMNHRMIRMFAEISIITSLKKCIFHDNVPRVIWNSRKVISRKTSVSLINFVTMILIANATKLQRNYLVCFITDQTSAAKQVPEGLRN